MVLSPPGLLSLGLPRPDRQVLWVLPTHPRSAGAAPSRPLTSSAPDPAGLSHPGLCVTRALPPHDLQTHPESAGPGASTPRTPHGRRKAARRPPAESRSPAPVWQRPLSPADVGVGGRGDGPYHRGAKGKKELWPAPPALPRGMVRPGRVKARGRRRGLRRRRYGAASWKIPGQGRNGPGGIRRTRAEQRCSRRQHPLGLHRRGAQRAAERAHPAAAVCAEPGQGAEPRGHDQGKAPGRPAGGRARRREVALDARGDWSQAPPEVSVCCVTLNKWLSLSGPVFSLEQGGLDEMIKITIANS